MNIHKFNVKSKNKSTHKTVRWIIPTDIRSFVKKVNKDTWEFTAKRILYYNLKKLNIYF